MISLIIAGGISAAAASQTTEVTWPDMNNHTLRGEIVLAKEVVCRNRWGTPMLPDGKGGYSLIAPINRVDRGEPPAAAMGAEWNGRLPSASARAGSRGRATGRGSSAGALDDGSSGSRPAGPGRTHDARGGYRRAGDHWVCSRRAAAVTDALLNFKKTPA
jgi:hypothetical protein